MLYRRMPLRTTLAAAILACAISTPLWSAQAEAPAEKPARRGTIGVSLLSKSIPYFVEVNEGLLAEAARRGYSVVVVDGQPGELVTKLPEPVEPPDRAREPTQATSS